MEQIKNLQEMQIEIKKELGGASLNHFINYFTLLPKKSTFDGFKVDMLWNNVRNGKNNVLVMIGVFPLYRSKDKPEVSFCDSYTLVDTKKRSLNIFAQSEDFQRKLYDAIQIIKNINFNQ